VFTASKSAAVTAPSLVSVTAITTGFGLARTRTTIISNFDEKDLWTGCDVGLLRSRSLSAGSGLTDNAAVEAIDGEVERVTFFAFHDTVRQALRFREEGSAQQLPICDSTPTPVLRSYALVARKNLIQRPGHALVQKNLHAGASRALSERSKTRQAISRVTDGKHSRNSSSV
jgi:hypothetical protein